MFSAYFNEFRSVYLNRSSKDIKFAFWNSMCDAASLYSNSDFKIMFDEISSLIIVNSIQDLFPEKYKERYTDSGLDVLDTAAIVWNRYSDECEKRFSIINNFSDNSSQKEGLAVLDKAIDVSGRYDKLIPFI